MKPLKLEFSLFGCHKHKICIKHTPILVTNLVHFNPQTTTHPVLIISLGPGGSVGMVFGSQLRGCTFSPISH